MSVRLLIGDALTRLRELPDASVHACVTSPPYYGLRAYGTNPQVWGGDPACSHVWQDDKPHVGRLASETKSEKQLSSRGAAMVDVRPTARGYCIRCAGWRGELGSEPTPEQYVANLVAVFREVRRVLHPSGVCIVNLGDSYAGSGKGTTGPNGIGDQAGRQGFTGSKGQRIGSVHGESGHTSGVTPPSGYKAKDQMQMPFRLAEALRQDGWYLRSTMPWLKRAAMPESVADRPSNALEWLFLFSKAARYFWDAEAIRQTGQPASEARYASAFGGAKAEALGEFGRTHPQGMREYTGGRAFRNTDPWFLSLDTAIADARADLARLEAMRATGGVLADDDGLPLAVDINPQGYKEAHFATYPPALVVPFVKAGTSERGACNGIVKKLRIRSDLTHEQQARVSAWLDRRRA